MPSIGAVVLALAAVLGPIFYSFFYADGPAQRKKRLAHIPEVRFDENDTPERYRTDLRPLLMKGYDQHLQHGRAFQLHNPVGELGNQVVLPTKYLDEVKSAPKSKFSFEEFSEKLFLLSYTDSPIQSDAATHAAKLDMNRNLDHVVDGIWTEGEVLLDETIKPGDWQSLVASELATNMIARMMSYVLVGPELCRNPGWQKVAIMATFAIVDASMHVRNSYSANWRWMAKIRNKTPKMLADIRQEAMDLISPLYEERLEALALKDKRGPDRFHDMLYWILGRPDADNTLKGLVDQQIFLTLASIHTTSGTLHSFVTDWLAHPEIHADIMAEIEGGLAEFAAAGNKWTLQRVAAMRKLDSFLKESSRLHPIGFNTVQRYASKTHVFKEGFVLPRGTIFHFAADATHHDPKLFPEPDKFDAYRFLRLREQGDPNQFHYGYVSDATLNWGAGSHACPGRFLAVIVLKFAFIQLVTRYDIKYPDGDSGKPGYFCNDNGMRVDPTQKLEFKLKA